MKTLRQQRKERLRTFTQWTHFPASLLSNFWRRLTVTLDASVSVSLKA